MSRFTGVLLLAVVIAATTPIAAPAQQEMTTAEIQTVKGEVQEAVEAYYRYYSEENMAVMPERVFHIPWIQIGGTEFRVDRTKEESLARFNESLANLKERGWGRSFYTVTNVCVLNERAAITSGYNTRYDRQGEVMSVGGVSYLLGRTGDGWRIVSYTGIPADRVISCD